MQDQREPTVEEQKAKLKAYRAHIGKMLKRSHGRIPFNPEGQAIGYAETRRDERKVKHMKKVIQTAAENPELFTEPPAQPDIIEGEAKPVEES